MLFPTQHDLELSEAPGDIQRALPANLSAQEHRGLGTAEEGVEGDGGGLELGKQILQPVDNK